MVVNHGDVSTVCRRQKDLNVELTYRRSTAPLNLPVDSTGIKFLGEGKWKHQKHEDQKHEAALQRQWRKVLDASTL